MHTFPAIEWLTDWKREATGTPHAQREYVKRELKRIAEAGAPVLSMILSAPFEIQTHLALSLLHQRALGSHRFYFRLVPGAKPPPRDPQGRELDDSERGKVLVAKVGTKGGQLHGSHNLPGVVTDEFTGPAVQNTAHNGEDIYEYVRIGREPVAIDNINDAVVMMRRYGFRLAQPRYKGKAKKRNDKGEIVVDRDVYGEAVPEIDFWMVEEIPPSSIAPDGSVRDPKKVDAQSNTGKRAA
jgi:hypothetical protein